MRARILSSKWSDISYSIRHVLELPLVPTLARRPGIFCAGSRIAGQRATSSTFLRLSITRFDENSFVPERRVVSPGSKSLKRHSDLSQSTVLLCFWPPIYGPPCDVAATQPAIQSASTSTSSWQLRPCFFLCRLAPWSSQHRTSAISHDLSPPTNGGTYSRK